MAGPNINLPDLKTSIPGAGGAAGAGYLIGRTRNGVGRPHLISIDELTQTASQRGAGVAGSGGSGAALPDSGVTAGSYTLTSLTVNAKGLITAASNGSVSSGLLPLVTGDTPGVTLIGTDLGECIGVPQ